MFNRKSIYALNKKDPDAIVYTAFSKEFEISVFVSLALVLQAANMYL